MLLQITIALLAIQAPPSTKVPVRVNQIEAHPEKSQLAALMSTGDVRILDVRTGEELGSWKGAEFKARSVHYSRDGHTLLTVSREGWVHARSPLTGEIQETLLPGLAKTARKQRTLLFSPDGSRLLVRSAGAPFSLWSTETWQEIAKIPWGPKHWTSAQWNGGGSLFATIGPDHPLQLWSGKDGTLQTSPFKTPPEGSNLDFQQNGARLAVIRKITGPSEIGGWRQVIEIWDMSSGELLKSLEDWGTWGKFPAHSIQAQFSPDGNHLMGTSGSGIVASWNMKTFELEWLTSPEGGMPFVFPAEYVLGGSAILVSGNFIDDSCLMNATTMERMIELPNRQEGTSLISADGRSIAAINEAGALEVFDTITRNKRFTRWEYEGGEVQILTPSPMK